MLCMSPPFFHPVFCYLRDEEVRSFKMFKCCDFVKMFLLVVLVRNITSEWVKISQVPSTANSQHAESESDVLVQTDLLGGIFDKNEINSVKINNITPSKEWIEYQKQRFETAGYSQKLIVNAENNLKTSTKIVFPLTITSELKNLTNSDVKPFKKIYDIQLLNDFQINLDKIPNKSYNTSSLINLDVGLPNTKDELSNLNQVSTSIESMEIDISTKIPVKVDDKMSSLFEPEIEGINLKPTKPTTMENNAPKSELKSGGSSGFLNFLKNVQNNLITKTSKSIQEKINKLAALRDELLINIEDKVSTLWIPQKKRNKRSMFEEHSIHFPSIETALMTINFLTFAVFLIKLVLQVINVLKSKHYNLGGLSINTMEAMNMAKIRNVRSFGEMQDDIELTEKILRAVENNTKI